MSGLEYDLVEGPLIEQLRTLGWSCLQGDAWEVGATERSSWREVVLDGRLREALHRINLGPDGGSWLDGERLSQAVSAMTKAGAGLRLVEANQAATDLLLSGIEVPGVEGWNQGRNQTVRYIDWDDPDNNDFLVINQFRVDEPGGQAKTFIAPDGVLLVNGIPLVVVECKAPVSEDAMAEAIRQLRRYANQREDVDAAEGNEQLFWANQLVVATTFDEARVGTVTAGPEHFLEWKDTAPIPKEQVAAELGRPVGELSGQELLVAGALRPAHLLDLVRHFCVFDTTGGRMVKKVARYQQFRGVHRSIERLKSGQTRLEDGEADRRGGVIWHTQGSGKSLTMVFLVRKMRSDTELRGFKVVAVTDRTDLQRQLSSAAQLTGETVTVARTTAHLRQVLAQPGPGLVMAMIQKYRDGPDSEPGLADDQDADALLEEVNTDPAILVLVDEAHRSHASMLHANLLAALPNAARIGFTGTPIVMGAKKKTREIFGPFLDTYTLTQSEADGSTVPILYEGRTTDAAVRGASDLDAVFFRWFDGLSDEQRDELQRKYARLAEVLEAPELIAGKARDMLRHYASTVMPQGFKGMVVASSRLACVRYRETFLAARDELVADIEALDPAIATLDGDAIDRLPPDKQVLVRARPRLGLLKALEFVPVISGAHNDSADWATWTDPSQQQAHIEAFKKPLGPATDSTDPTAIVMVKSMLLTGFDAPVAQVLYLDRMIREAELLQAIARVNRTAAEKSYGLVVDYYGIVHYLTQALAAYTDPDGHLDELVEGSLRSLREEVGRLADRHARVAHLFTSRHVEPSNDPTVIEECVQLLEDPELRARFDVDLKKFLTSLDTILPRPEARPYVADAKLFGRIQIEVRRRYRDHGDGSFNPSLYREKVRQLIDEHVTVLDLARRIAPVRITDVDFKAKVAALPTARAKASEMEHAARYHIRAHLREDPARYQKLSERLDQILNDLDQKWDQLALALDELIDEMKTPPERDETGLDPATELPFHGLLAETAATYNADHQAQVVELTRQIVGRVRDEVGTVGFWNNPHKQDQLRRWIKRELDTSDLFESLDVCDELAARLVDLARHNHHRLVRS